MKFKIEEKEEYIFRNIRFSKELFDNINKVKGNNSFTKFVIEAIKYALDNMDEQRIKFEKEKKTLFFLKLDYVIIIKIKVG